MGDSGGEGEFEQGVGFFEERSTSAGEGGKPGVCHANALDALTYGGGCVNFKPMGKDGDWGSGGG